METNMISLNYNDNMSGCVECICDFIIFKDGHKLVLNNSDKEFELTKEKIKKIFQQARVMPAFGVSLDNETQNALKSGCWLQINFSHELEVNGLLFNALLFKLETTSGFNLIRLHDGQYEGRCIYLDFDEILDLKQIFNIS